MPGRVGVLLRMGRRKNRHSGCVTSQHRLFGLLRAGVMERPRSERGAKKESRHTRTARDAGLMRRSLNPVKPQPSGTDKSKTRTHKTQTDRHGSGSFLDGGNSRNGMRRAANELGMERRQRAANPSLVNAGRPALFSRLPRYLGTYCVQLVTRLRYPPTSVCSWLRRRGGGRASSIGQSWAGPLSLGYALGPPQAGMWRRLCIRWAGGLLQAATFCWSAPSNEDRTGVVRLSSWAVQ